jgi:hypothetical protein
MDGSVAEPFEGNEEEAQGELQLACYIRRVWCSSVDCAAWRCCNHALLELLRDEQPHQQLPLQNAIIAKKKELLQCITAM